MTDETRQIRLLLVGLGNVGRRVLELLLRKQDAFRQRLHIEVVLIGAADTTGAAICPAGLDPQQIIALKVAGQGVADYPHWGQPGTSALQMVHTARASSPDLLLDASPANLKHGQPGLGCVEAALMAGMHVVTANKAPLVLAFAHLLELARNHGTQLRFDATVAGGLPAVNLGQRDLAVADIHRLEGILNLTTNYILTRMAEDGLSYHEALAHAQAAGHAEANPSLDVEGWDAASKLVILAHSVLGYPATLDDVDVQGITNITPAALRQATAQGKRVKLVATAEREDSRYRLSVGPAWLETSHPLSRLTAKQMGIVFHTDVCGILSAAIVEATPVPTAAAMLRDIVDIYSAR